jgi:hypothetical protein
VSGDGLPVSGLLTVLRNVLDLGLQEGTVAPTVPTDLGYSWRPDKAAYFPAGPKSPEIHPTWMDVVRNPFVELWGAAALASELNWIRSRVAYAEGLSPPEGDELEMRIDTLADLYRRHFGRWLADANPDWVIAMNMTLSDAVPATKGLQKASDDHFRKRPLGGVVYWDHDLFGTCAIDDPATGERMYPCIPNRFTPLPQVGPRCRWLVVSLGLQAEAARYPTGALPTVVPNVLPEFFPPVEQRHRTFIAQLGVAPGRPILLNPVRVFMVKGVDLALGFFSRVVAMCRQMSEPAPLLFVFGSLDEDPVYARSVVRLASDLRIQDDVRFLNGVPLSSYVSPAGAVSLDETDLLVLARHTSGGVIFTPGANDVETVGLGPALAGVAEIPLVTTNYRAFDRVYGQSFSAIRIPADSASWNEQAQHFVTRLRAVRERTPAALRELSENHAIVATRFHRGPWSAVLRELNSYRSTRDLNEVQGAAVGPRSSP